MAKKEQIDPEVIAAEKAAHVNKTVDVQVKEDVSKAEAAAVKAGKETELLEDQVWAETTHENPFEFVSHAQILEVRTNSTNHLFIKFQAYEAERVDRKEPIGYVNEQEFRARFPKFVK